MDPNLIVGLKEEYASLSSDGFRVLAVATKELAGEQICSKHDETDLVLKRLRRVSGPAQRHRSGRY
jgi:P-type Mg2+ transporter